MMSNCGFWSASGELLAVHGSDSDPVATFGPWAAHQRLPSGRLVALSPSFPVPPAVSTGWQLLRSDSSASNRRTHRPCDPSASVATPAPALDEAAARLCPSRTEHEKFTLRAWPTWTASVKLHSGEGPAGWYAALLGPAKVSRFLVRLVPHRGRLPGEGWRNMLAWSLHQHSGVRLVPLNGLPTDEALAVAPAWEYRVEAGHGLDAAAWDVQLLPSRALLNEWAPDTSDPWEATALLRWVRPGAKAPAAWPLAPGTELRWADLFARLPVGDARLLVQNVLTTLPGGVTEAAALFFDTVTLPTGPDGRTLVRYVPQDGLPVALLSTLFSRRAWHEVERAKRFLPSEGERRTQRREAFADLDRRLAEGRLEWSGEALELWRTLYRVPQHTLLEDELAGWKRSDPWTQLLKGSPLIVEAVLRELDVTDAALCLRDAPDRRWRRFVSASKESEIREELAFCRDWEARGELTLERELDAWRSLDALVRRLSTE